MSETYDQSSISRRFHVAFTTDGKNTLAYDCSFDDKVNFNRSPKSAEGALLEFHRYMQRQRKIKPHEYTVIGLTDTYRDIAGTQIVRDYPITKTANPDLSPATKHQEEPFTMFDDAQVKEQSKLASMRFAR